MALAAATLATLATTAIHAVATHDTTRCLGAHVLRDRIIDVTQLSIAMSVLTVLVVLAVPLIIEMPTLLCLESLINLSVFNGATAHRVRSRISAHVLLLLLRLLRGHHLLLLHEVRLLVHLLGLLIRVHHHGLLLLLLSIIGHWHARHPSLTWLLRRLVIRRHLSTTWRLLLLGLLRLRFTTVVWTFLHPKIC